MLMTTAVAAGHRPRVLKLDGTSEEYARLGSEFGVRGYPSLFLVAPVDNVRAVA